MENSSPLHLAHTNDNFHLEVLNGSQHQKVFLGNSFPLKACAQNRFPYVLSFTCMLYLRMNCPEAVGIGGRNSVRDTCA